MKHRHRHRRGTGLALVVTLAGVVAACATAHDGDRSQRPDQSQRPDPNRITQAELGNSSHLTAEEAIRGLRPAWLRYRGSISINDRSGGDLVVYWDGQRLGGADVLRTIRVDQVGTMEFLGARDATIRYGTGHAGGAVLLHSKR